MKKLCDVRLWTASRFVPYASGKNLSERLGEKYLHLLECAPTTELLTDYKSGTIDWNGYEKIYNQILSARKIEKLFTKENLDGMCFLCSEKTSDQCHRRLLAEYLQKNFDMKTVYL